MVDSRSASASLPGGPPVVVSLSASRPTASGLVELAIDRRAG